MGTTENLNIKNYPNKLLDIVYSFYKTMKEREITLVYQGEITHQLTKAFTSITKERLSINNEEISVQRKVFHVMIECLQNISRHSDQPITDNTSFSNTGIFLVTKSKSEYAIISGNAIDNDKLENLKSSIDYINTLSREELKALYAKQILQGDFSEKGGAGLGFIDIVRKTQRKLEYNFLKIDNNTSFFILTSFISRV